MFERIRLMNKRALLLSGFLNENDIKNVQDNVTGNNIDLETLKNILIKKTEKPVTLSFVPGKPNFDYIDKKYSNILNEYYKRYKDKSFFPQPDWCFKSVEISPLLCNSVFLDLDKINYFQSLFNDSNYEDVLRICLDVHESEIKLKFENNGITLSTTNPNILGLLVNQHLHILPQVNPSAVKVARINDKYELIDGKHRAVALYRSGHKKIPAIVFNSASPYKIQSNYYFPLSILLRESSPAIGHYLNENFVTEVPLMSSISVFRVIIDKSVIQI